MILILSTVILALLDSRKCLFSAVHEFSELNSGIRAMVPLKESNRLKIDYGEKHKILEILMCGFNEFLLYNHIKMFNDDLCDKNLVLIIGENETESFLFLSLFMGTGVSPVRHGRARAHDTEFNPSHPHGSVSQEARARNSKGTGVSSRARACVLVETVQ